MATSSNAYPVADASINLELCDKYLDERPTRERWGETSVLYTPVLYNAHPQPS